MLTRMGRSLRLALAVVVAAAALCGSSSASGVGVNFWIDASQYEACSSCVDSGCKFCIDWVGETDDEPTPSAGACHCDTSKNFRKCHFALADSDRITSQEACRTLDPATQAAGPSCSTCPEGCSLCRSPAGRLFCDCTGYCRCDESGGKCNTFRGTSYTDMRPACAAGEEIAPGSGDFSADVTVTRSLDPRVYVAVAFGVGVMGLAAFAGYKRLASKPSQPTNAGELRAQ